MSSRAIRGPLRYDNFTVVTSGNLTVVNESVVVVNKTAGAATTVTLPPSRAVASAGPLRQLIVIDGKGDANTNNITLAAAGSDTINGSATLAVSVNYAYVVLTDCGAGKWAVESLESGGAGAFSSLTLTGSFTDSSASAVSAAGTTQGTATALTLDVNNVSTVGANAGVALPAATAGRGVTVVNAGANALKVYPVNGGTDLINGLGANNPTLVPVGQTAFFECAVAGTWNTLVIPPREFVTGLATAGAGTVTAAGIVGGTTQRTGAQSNTNFTDTTDTVANLIAALHGAAVGQAWEWTYENQTNAVATIAGAANVTVSGITAVPPGTWARYLVTFATATTFTVVGYASGPNVASLPPARTTTAPTNAQNNVYTTNGVLSDLTLEVAAGQKVSGALQLFGKNATAANGFGIDFNGGTATFTSVEFGWVSTPVGVTTVGTRTSAALGTPVTITTLADTNDVCMTVYFTGVVNAAGTVIPRFASIGGATTATVEVGATFTLNTTGN